MAGCSAIDGITSRRTTLSCKLHTFPLPRTRVTVGVG
jgi:hypothetical protein